MKRGGLELTSATGESDVAPYKGKTRSAPAVHTRIGAGLQSLHILRPSAHLS